MGCATAGAAVGALGHPQLAPESQPLGANIRANLPQTDAQSGEDQIVHFILEYLNVRKRNDLDVGAWAPVLNNNTYLLDTLGYRGALVEPNVEACKKLREGRPGEE